MAYFDVLGETVGAVDGQSHAAEDEDAETGHEGQRGYQRRRHDFAAENGAANDLALQRLLRIELVFASEDAETAVVVT